ncbi:aminotransferase, DegT/DnrJ/EryC1/StrS family [Campylobacter pinnipediorum subsp. caledonicus]|uniref:DegT/DnrJ/EryC1/StrS family aminotransferase n=1 Tax=Campylobacter pinnipediorum TaxID=1965231 RepID=UPI000995662B|nr:DegT/DnrJ/EryC1/StrS aminotransferase family protein [Campylobacter pinnipediorum]AQW85862.1 aminotransferase, DegT/DnrJ/EryC1/StrS family [Campylobacter pinnipediorum subsp. caledonicus]
MQEILFYKPSMDNEELDMIKKALSDQNTNIIDDFEASLRKTFDVKYAITTINNAATHHLALSAMEVKRGDKFICSVNAFPSVAQAIRYFDAEPIFVDINEDDFTINPQALEESLKKNNHKKLKGIFVNHVAGQAAMMDEIEEIAKKYDVHILEDANRAVGLTYKGEKIGAKKSLFTCFQIHSQTINPTAAAGFMVTNNDEIAKKAQLLRNYAMVSGLDKSGNMGYIYDVVDIGLKYDLTTLNGAFAFAQFKKHEAFAKKRQEIAAIYDEELKDCPHISLPVKKRDHIYNQYIIKVDKNRDGFAKELLENGIHTSLHYVPIHLLTYYKSKYRLKVNAFPNALKNYQQILSLPIYGALTEEEIYYICDKIKEIAKNRV